MNGRVARMLRKQSGYQPNVILDDNQYNEKKFNRMEYKNGVLTQVVKVTRSLKFESTRAKYRDLKQLHRLAGV